MPEGDTILRTAQTLHKALRGKPITRAKSIVAAAHPERMHGRSVEKVDAHGKNLLIHFDDGSSLHSHMMMNGSWHVYRPGQRWRQPAFAARVVLETADCVAVCFSAPVVEWIAPGRAAHNARLATLGPDILSSEFDVALASSRLRALGAVPLGEAVVHQQAVAGIGNIYKSETLFVCRSNPFAPVELLSDDALAAILQTARRLMKRNLGPGERRTRPAQGGPAVWVYRRSGERCLVCDGRVEMRRQGPTARSTYYCAACQGVEPAAPQR